MFNKKYTVLGETITKGKGAAQTFSMEKNVPDSFYKSMLNSFTEVIHFTSVQGVFTDFKERILKIYTETQNQKWPLEEEFSKALDIID